MYMDGVEGLLSNINVRRKARARVSRAHPGRTGGKEKGSDDVNYHLKDLLAVSGYVFLLNGAVSVGQVIGYTLMLFGILFGGRGSQ